jgi:hypothetical protein
MFGAGSDEKEIEGEGKAKSLIAHKDKVGCTEEKMRDDEDELGEARCVREKNLSPSKKD